MYDLSFFFFFQAEDGIRDKLVTGVQTCALPISLVEALNIGPRKVGGDNRAVVLTCARPAHRAPLTEPDTVAPSRARRDEPGDLAGVLRHGELEGRAAEQLIGLRSQHRAHLGAGHPYVTVLERDAQLADPARGRGAGYRDIRA